MDICHIVAMTENGVIGQGGAMPWHIPAELKYFKRTTMGNCLLMGRKTFESIGKPLPGRLNVVVTRNKNYAPEGVHVAHDVETALAFCQQAVEDGDFGPDTYIVGGGEIYRATMDIVDRIHLTVIHRTIDGDTLYPAIDYSKFKVEDRQEFVEPERYTTQVLIRTAL